MILPKVSQHILGHDIAKSIPKYPRPWHFSSSTNHLGNAKPKEQLKHNSKNYFFHFDLYCRNPSFGLATKAKGLQGCGPRGSPGVTSETLESVRECEGVSLHIPKATPTLGDGVPVDSRNFRDWFEGSNLNGLWRSLYQWKRFWSVDV